MLAKAGVTPADVDLVVPHQANLRIIELVAKRIGIPMERVFLTIARYGNMSAATVPVALVEALEEGRVPPRALLLMPAFGGGLTWCAHLVRCGARTAPLDVADVELPPCDETALDLVNALRARKVEPRTLAGRPCRADLPGDAGHPGGQRRRRLESRV